MVRISQRKQPDIAALSRNPNGVPFQCPTCEYFQQGVCGNPHPDVHGKQVDASMCCDYYDHPGMVRLT